MQQTAHQLSLFSGAEEAQMFHESGRAGFFSILVDVNGNKRQSSHRLTEMPNVIELIDKNRDTWISQAEFILPNRRVVNLARVGLLFADLDTYRMDWAQGRSPEQLADSVLYHCQQEGIPTPSMLIFSGRGIQAKWLLEYTLPRAALPRWNACQRYLVDRLKPAGADVGAKDASRVLRLVDTVNSKSGEICRVVHVENGADGQPVRYNFEYLAEMLLPIARWDIEKQKQQRDEREKRKQLKLIGGGKSDNLRGFSGRQLAWHRLEDLRTLMTLRGGVVAEGDRMRHLHWQLNFLLLSGATNRRLMYQEAATLARKIDAGWGHNCKELMTLYSKAKQFEAGEKVSFGGKEYPALYTPRNDTLINLFEITDSEQAELRTIISKGMALNRRRDRDRKRDESVRRSAGAVSREIYLGEADLKQERAQQLRVQGLSVRAIAEQMGISKTAVGRYIQAENISVPSPSPITNGEALAVCRAL